jgi:hypothetical protein
MVPKQDEFREWVGLSLALHLSGEIMGQIYREIPISIIFRFDQRLLQTL